MNWLRELPGSVARLTELERLMLGDNPIERIPNLSGLKNLKTLAVCHTLLDYVPDWLPDMDLEKIYFFKTLVPQWFVNWVFKDKPFYG